MGGPRAAAHLAAGRISQHGRRPPEVHNSNLAGPRTLRSGHERLKGAGARAPRSTAPVLRPCRIFLSLYRVRTKATGAPWGRSCPAQGRAGIAESKSMAPSRPGKPEAPEQRCATVGPPDDMDLGAHWAVIKGVEVPGSPAITSAAVGEQGTVLIAAVAATGPLTARTGHLYCGDVPLEPVIGELAAACKALADDLPPAMGDDPTSINALLIVPEARATFTHRNVIVTSADQAASALFSLPVVHAPEEVRLAKSVLRDRTARVLPLVPSGKAPVPLQVAPGAGGPGKARSRRGRWRAQPMVWLVAAAALMVAVFAIWRLYSGSSNAPPPAQLGAGNIASADTTAVPAHMEAVAYQGQQPGDVVATSTGVAEIAGVRVTLGDPVFVPALVGHMLLCVPVSVENRGTAAAVTGALTWALRTPTGALEHPASMATNEVVSKGHLFPGQAITGKLCFNEAGEGGVYIITFSPHPSSAARSRGVWVERLPRIKRPR